MNNRQYLIRHKNNTYMVVKEIPLKGQKCTNDIFSTNFTNPVIRECDQQQQNKVSKFKKIYDSDSIQNQSDNQTNVFTDSNYCLIGDSNRSNNKIDLNKQIVYYQKISEKNTKKSEKQNQSSSKVDIHLMVQRNQEIFKYLERQQQRRKASISPTRK